MPTWARPVFDFTTAGKPDGLRRVTPLTQSGPSLHVIMHTTPVLQISVPSGLSWERGREHPGHETFESVGYLQVVTVHSTWPLLLEPPVIRAHRLVARCQWSRTSRPGLHDSRHLSLNSWRLVIQVSGQNAICYLISHNPSSVPGRTVRTSISTYLLCIIAT
jgi:hypothetical protein